MKIFVPVVLCAAIVFAGCAAYGPDKAVGSGFLGGPAEYAKMQQIKGFLRKAAYAWVADDVNWNKYNKILVDDIQVRFTSPQMREQVDREHIVKFKELYREAMMRQLGGDFRIVNNAGPGVLVIRSCLTGLQPNKAARNIALGAVGAPTIYSGKTSIELDFRDGASNRRVATFMDTKAAEFAGLRSLTDSYTKWGSVRSAFIKWAKELDKTLKGFKEGKAIQYREPK